MPKTIAVLHLEDNAADAELIGVILHREFPDCSIRVASSKEQFEQALSRGPFDVILSDYSLPSFTGLDALKLACQRLSEVPFIFVSGAIGEERAIESLQRGATDYVLKDRLARLTPAIQRALAEREERDLRRRSETALHESELLYQVLVETSPDAIVLADLEKRITMVNRHMIDLFGGTSPDDLVSRTAYDLVVPEERSRVDIDAQAVLEKGIVRNMEYHLFRKDGTTYPAEVDASVLHDPHGAPRAFLAIVRDISERIRIREALRESEDRYRSLVETSPDAVLLTALDGTILFCNQRAADLLGFDEAREMFGKPAFEFIAVEDHSQVRTMASRIRTEERVYSYEYTLVTRTGKRIQVDVSSSLLRDRNGQPRAFTSFLRDVTRRRKNEEKIAEQAALLDVHPASIIVCSLDDRIQFWNRGAERLFGWSSSEAVGTLSTEYLAPSAFEDHRKARQALLAGGSWRGNLTRIRKDGSTVPVESEWRLVSHEDGSPKAVYVVETDISEKLKLQSQILRAQRLESIGTLAGGIAHDLNNVLGPILLSLQVFRRKLNTEQDLRLLDMIEKSAHRGAAMIKQVLTFARGIEGERIRLNLQHLVREIQSIAHQTFPRSISFKTSIPSDLWAITGDATQVHQVLLNLAVNARDAMPRGGTITVEAKNILVDEAYAGMHRDAQPGSYVCCTVADTGTGIPPEVLDRIFDPFFTTKEQGKGTGLGLSTTLGIVKSHNGFINVYSEPGRGSRFAVYLPAEPQAAAAAAPSETGVIPRGQGEIILVADDEPTILEVTRAALEANGYSVLTAADGTEAIAQAASHRGRIAVVVCDMNMPHMSGQATIRALHRLDAAIAFIAVSGMIDSIEKRDFEEFGLVRTLQKPFTAERLLRTIHELIQGPRSEK